MNVFAESVVAYAQAGWPRILPVPPRDKYPPPVGSSLPGGEVALYRHVDADGYLLYIGITNDPVRRWEEHRAVSKWSRYVTATYVQWFPDRASASRAEVVAIGSEAPLFNDRRPRAGGWVHDTSTGAFAQRRLRYQKTGTSDLPRWVPCRIFPSEFCVACGPDRETHEDAVWARSLADPRARGAIT